MPFYLERMVVGHLRQRYSTPTWAMTIGSRSRLSRSPQIPSNSGRPTSSNFETVGRRSYRSLGTIGLPPSRNKASSGGHARTKLCLRVSVASRSSGSSRVVCGLGKRRKVKASRHGVAWRETSPGWSVLLLRRTARRSPGRADLAVKAAPY